MQKDHKPVKRLVQKALANLNCPPKFQNAQNIFFFGCGVCCDNSDGCLENTLDLSREILPKAEKAGYTVASFLGENATVENYRSMLMCENIKIFYSVIRGMKTLSCTQIADDLPRVLSNPLKAGEVAFAVTQNNSCPFFNIFNPKYDPPVDQFGIYPAENCTGGENSSQSM